MSDENGNGDRILSLDEILASDDVEYLTIDGYQPGEKIRIGSLTAGDLIEWQDANETEAKKTAGLRLIVKSLVDADGKRIATDKHIQFFRKKNHKKTETIVKRILKLNGIKVVGWDLSDID
jgi:hypothetical protein